MSSRKRPGFTMCLVKASHPGESLLIAVGVTVAAVLAGRPLREVGLVFVTVLLGRLTAGWLNDAADRRRDAAAGRTEKPVAQGWIDGGTVTFTVACATLVLIPLSISNGTAAGVAHLLAVLAAWVYCTRIKTTPFSFLPWAVSFALYPAFLSYGGWGGGMHGGPPTVLMTVLAGLLGIGVHVVLALRDLVIDHKIGLRTFPLLLGLRIGATKLLVASVIYTLAVLAAMAWAGATSGLVQ
jgi:4-hydroxybenzoate polyprenyltransferase